MFRMSVIVVSLLVLLTACGKTPVLRELADCHDAGHMAGLASTLFVPRYDLGSSTPHDPLGFVASSATAARTCFRVSGDTFEAHDAVQKAAQASGHDLAEAQWAFNSAPKSFGWYAETNYTVSAEPDGDDPRYERATGFVLLTAVGGARPTLLIRLDGKYRSP